MEKEQKLEEVGKREKPQEETGESPEQGPSVAEPEQQAANSDKAREGMSQERRVTPEKEREQRERIQEAMKNTKRAVLRFAEIYRGGEEFNIIYLEAHRLPNTIFLDSSSFKNVAFRLNAVRDALELCLLGKLPHINIGPDEKLPEALSALEDISASGENLRSLLAKSNEPEAENARAAAELFKNAVDNMRRTVEK